MSDDRTARRRPSEQHAQELDARAEQREERDRDGERIPSPIERREWRGSGVCGDRHTD